jgi:AcrR family transcriptional regulator
MRRIAAELGGDPMAIDRHYPNREALLDAVADLALADVADPGPGSGWSARITTILTEVRAVALRHPGIAAHVAARPPLGANGARLGAGIHHALGAAGLPPEGVAYAAQALIAYVAAALAMAVNAGTRDAAARGARRHQVSRAMEGLPGDVMPVVGSAEQFGYGLRLLLNGVAVEAGR